MIRASFLVFMLFYVTAVRYPIFLVNSFIPCDSGASAVISDKSTMENICYNQGSLRRRR